MSDAFGLVIVVNDFSFTVIEDLGEATAIDRERWGLAVARRRRPHMNSS
jgi:hypothetical protein